MLGKEVSKEDISKLVKFFELLIEIDKKQKDKEKEVLVHEKQN